MAKQPPVDLENVLKVDISAIALDERFGSLKFVNAGKKLSNIQRYIKEADDLGFRDLLLSEQVKRVEDFWKRLTQHVQWLQNFDLTTSGNPKGEYDSFENQIDSFYNEVYTLLVMQYLPFLREERRRENPQERKLDEEVRLASQLRIDLEKELKQVKADIEQIRQTKPEVASAKGERAAVKLAKHFQAEATRYETAAKHWSWAVYVGYLVVIIVIGCFAYAYVNELETAAVQAQINTTVWLSVGAAKLVFALGLWYGLSFLIRNYNVNSHLAAINRHRTAVASTLEDFLDSNPERQTEMLRNATEAMFKQTMIGYVSKNDNGSSNPIYETINQVMGAKGNGTTVG